MCALTQNGDVLGQLFDQSNNTRAHVGVSQGGAVQVLFQGVGAIGALEALPVNAGRETEDGSAFGEILRPAGGTGTSCSGTGIVSIGFMQKFLYLSVWM